MPDLITSVGPHKQYPYLTLGSTSSTTPRSSSSPARPDRRPFLVRKNTPLKATRVRIGTGDRGIGQTIRYMYGAAMGNEGVGSPEIRRQALQIVQGVASRDQQGEITAVLQWVKRNVAFRGEYAETVQTPLVTLQLRAGDCDDQATLLAALLGSLGYKTRFRTVAADPSAPWAYSHVFTEVFHRKSGQWVSLDSTVPQSYPGWQPPRVFRSQAWRTMGDPGDATSTSTGGAATATGPLPKSQLVFQLLSPLSLAVSDRIRFGANPPRPKSLNVDLNTTSFNAGSGISPAVVYVGGALALGTILVLAFRGGRGRA